MRMSTGHECTKRKLPTEVALGCRRPTLASKGMEQTSVNTVISNLFQSDTENSRSSNRYNYWRRDPNADVQAVRFLVNCRGSFLIGPASFLFIFLLFPF